MRKQFVAAAIAVLSGKRVRSPLQRTSQAVCALEALTCSRPTRWLPRHLPLAREPVDSCGEVKQSEEGSRGLLVSCGNRTPFPEPGPAAFDAVAVGVDPVGTSHRCLVLACRDRRSGTEVPDVLAEDAAAVARSATTKRGICGTRWGRGTACGSSSAGPCASAKVTARPALSALTQALVPKPPRERPSAWYTGASGVFCLAPPLSDARGSRCYRG